MPWYSRLAWVNLYPTAPIDPPGNPAGPLREAQDPFVGDHLLETMETLVAKRVMAPVGPYWWPAGASAPFSSLGEEPKPLSRAGRLDGRTWIVGWHPGGANRRGWDHRHMPT